MHPRWILIIVSLSHVIPSGSTSVRRMDVVLGDDVTLDCDIEDARIVEWSGWTQRAGPILSTNNSTGSLSLQGISIEDEGLYRCVSTAPNNKSILGTFIHLHVQVEAVLTDFYPESSPILIEEGSVVLKCSAIGRPIPEIRWNLQDPSIFQLVEELEEKKDRAGYVRSRVRVEVNSTSSASSVNVSCTASNSIRESSNGSTRIHSDSKMFALLYAPDSKSTIDDGSILTGVEEEEPSGYCARYSGQVCRGHLSDPSSVWFNISSSDASGGWLNEQLAQGLVDEVIRTLREPCQSAARRLLCLYAFPECHLDEDGYARRLPLCYEDCIATRQLFCVEEWAKLESEKERGFFLGSRGHFRLPRCEDLPRMGSRSGTYFSSSSFGSKQLKDPYGLDPPTCSRAQLTQLIPAQVTTSCIKGRGRFYQGNVSETKDGIPCQRWDAQEPHSHNQPPLHIFPEMQGAENFCRNAGGEKLKPWCYTTDPLVRWQQCDIPYCGSGMGDEGGVEMTPMLKVPMESTFTPGFVLLLSGIGFLSLLILFLFMLLCRRAFKPKRGYRIPSLQKQSTDIDLQKLRDNSTYQCVTIANHIHPALEKLEYPRNDIIYMKDLGHGAFGRVFQAKAPHLVKGEPCTIVAVKTLKEEADEETRANFEKEAILLAELDHPNIIALLGVCALEKPFCLLLEFMALGDLRQYLRSCAASNYPTGTTTSSGHPPSNIGTLDGSTTGSNCGNPNLKLYATDLTSMGRQIAAGMVFLSQRGFVHRDLATRNCLVGPDGSVKIADFGLSQRVLHWQQYYCGTDNDAIPIRWMPLESIVFNRYTTASDVWAFGVCLWEIFSHAQQPYSGMSHEEVVRYLQSGGVLGPPAAASCAVYAVMRSCWAASPTDRPDFVHLHEELVSIEEALLRQEQAEESSILPTPV